MAQHRVSPPAPTTLRTLRPARSARLRSTSTAALTGLLVLGLAGCGTAPWDATDDASTASASPTATTTSSATPEPAPTETITVIQNDLASGNAKRTLTAGAATLEATYWSTLSMDKWLAGSSKPLSVALTGSLVPDDGQGLYLSRVSVAIDVIGPDGALEGPPPAVDETTVEPGYTINAPYTYNQTFVVPAIDPAAVSVTFTITYELLIQTTPKSTEYAKQTAVDTLTVAIAAPPGDGDS